MTVFPQGRFFSDSGEALLQAAKAGLGIAALPSFLAATAIESGSLVPVLRDFPMPEGGIYVVRPPGPHLPGKLRVLIDLLVERFGGEPYWDACAMHRLKAVAA